ncbi:hypothetical protein TWF730_003568 [Orbilia blumenaviensis]|uniref:N-acetyltransferase domain-containing protein n=1 Tax=Orbilia blumenaviensis TaxID=1796055 RepID=A0AAV9U3B4_9PEZI
MSSIQTNLRSRSWQKDQFLVSTDPGLFPIPRVIEVFDSKDFYWASSVPSEAMEEMLRSSLSFGVYEQITPENQTDSTTENKFIGIARLITDYVTFAYLTDVWVDPTYQGKGLGSWLIGCVQEAVDQMPYLRRTMLFTADWKRSVPFYEKLMGMTVVETPRGGGLAFMEAKGKGHPCYGQDGYDYGV